MKKTFLLLGLALFLSLSFLSGLRLTASAETGSEIVPGTGKNPILYKDLPAKFDLTKGGYWGPLVTCTGNYSAASSNEKTCTSACDAIVQAEAIIYFVMTLLLYIGAPVMFLIGGLMIVFGGANPNMLSQGQKTLWGTAIGVALALSAYVIVSTFLWAVQPAGSGVKWPNIQCNPSEVPGGYLQFDYSEPAPGAQTGGGSGNLCQPPCAAPLICLRKGAYESGYECKYPPENICQPPCAAPQVCSVQNGKAQCVTPPASGSKCNNGKGCDPGSEACVQIGGGYSCYKLTTGPLCGKCAAKEACVWSIVGAACFEKE